LQFVYINTQDSENRKTKLGLGVSLGVPGTPGESREKKALVQSKVEAPSPQKTGVSWRTKLLAAQQFCLSDIQPQFCLQFCSYNFCPQSAAFRDQGKGDRSVCAMS